jgi:hypothetical protein
VDIEKLWAVFVLLIFGVGGCYAYIRWRAKSGKVWFLDGFVGGVLFLIASFIGELIAHISYPAAYRGIGDNPAQIYGFMTSCLISFFLCTFIGGSFRRTKRT